MVLLVAEVAVLVVVLIVAEVELRMPVLLTELLEVVHLQLHHPLRGLHAVEDLGLVHGALVRDQREAALAWNRADWDVRENPIAWLRVAIRHGVKLQRSRPRCDGLPAARDDFNARHDSNYECQSEF